MFGAIFDSTCLFWQFDCDRRGNCWVYDNLQLSNCALGLALSGIILNLIFSFLSWLTYPKSKPEKKASVSENPADQDNGETASVASSDSYSVEGPKIRPVHRTSLIGHMESHCSEDILLDSTDLGHIDDVIPMTDFEEEGRVKECGDENIETETALVGSMHDLQVRSIDCSSPLQVVASPTDSA